VSYHKVTVVGNLAAKPEMRFTPDGKPYATFRMASNDFGTTTWWRVTVWGNQAEPCTQYNDKGSLVLVEGRMNCDKATGSPRIWTDSGGNARAGYEISSSRVVFLGSREKTETAEKPVDTGDIPF
jgi:single-strand DNA-binding protein